MSDGNELNQDELDQLADAIIWRWQKALYETSIDILSETAPGKRHTIMGLMVIVAAGFAKENGVPTDVIYEAVDLTLGGRK